MEDQLKRSVELLAKIGTCYSPTFSPDDSEIAFISNMTGIPQIWKVSVDGGWPKLLTALEDPIASVYWSPTQPVLGFQLAPGGGMNNQVYTMTPEGSQMERLTNGGKETNWLADWTKDGKKLMINSNIRDASAMDSYLYDINTLSLDLVLENIGIGSIADLSADHSFAINYRLVHRSDDNQYLVNLQTKEEILLTPHEGPGSFSNARFSNNGKTIYLRSNNNRELVGFAKIGLNDNDQPSAIKDICVKNDEELSFFTLHPTDNQALLVWNRKGVNIVELFDLNTESVIEHIKLPHEIVNEVKFSHKGTKLAISMTGSTAPMNIFIYDLKTKVLRKLTDSPHAGVQLNELIKPKLVTFKSFDDLELSGWLYLPKNFEQPGAMALMFHGGPEAQERPMFRPDYQSILSQGVAILAPNVRGSSGFGKTFVNLDNGPLRFNGIKDIKACVDFVILNGYADTKKIGIAGGSYGGYMTMAGITDYPEHFAAAVNLFGIVNFETFFANTEPWMAAVSKIQYGDPETQADLLRDLSPIHKIDRVITPTLVLHGANDTNCPVVEAEQVVDNLKERGVEVKYILFQDEGHGFRKLPNRITSYVQMTKWFAKHLT